MVALTILLGTLQGNGNSRVAKSSQPGFLFFKIFILFICAYNVWVISLPFPPPPSFLSPLAPSLTPCYPAETILPLSLILLKRSISNNRKDQGFLLVEIRIAIQGVDSHGLWRKVLIWVYTRPKRK
jgi:hypothetical protein